MIFIILVLLFLGSLFVASLEQQHIKSNLTFSFWMYLFALLVSPLLIFIWVAGSVRETMRDYRRWRAGELPDAPSPPSSSETDPSTQSQNDESRLAVNMDRIDSPPAVPMAEHDPQQQSDNQEEPRELFSRHSVALLSKFYGHKAMLSMLGDLEEKYHELTGKTDDEKARIWLKGQVSRSIILGLKDTLARRLFRLLKRLGIAQ